MRFYYNYFKKIVSEKSIYFVILSFMYVVVTGYMFQRNLTSKWQPSELFLYEYNVLYFTVLFPFLILLLHPARSTVMSTERVRAKDRMEKAEEGYLFCLILLFSGTYIAVHKIGHLLFGLSGVSHLQYMEAFFDLTLQTWAYATVYRCFLFSTKSMFYLMATYFLITFLDCFFLGVLSEYSGALPLYSFVNGNGLKSSVTLIFVGMILAFREVRKMLMERREFFDSKI